MGFGLRVPPRHDASVGRIGGALADAQLFADGAPGQALLLAQVHDLSLALGQLHGRRLSPLVIVFVET